MVQLTEVPWQSIPLSLEKLTLEVVAMPLLERFRSAIGERRQRLALFVRWTDRDGCWGIGECSCRPDPYFNGEFLEGAVCVLRDHLFPRLAARGSVGELSRCVRSVRGWNFTVSALLDAAFDLLRRKGQPDPLQRWREQSLQRVPVGISLPLFDTSRQAVQRVGRALEEGYRRVKLKVSPAMNADTAAAVRAAFPSLHLGLDANGSFRPSDSALIEKLADLRPRPFEQPFPPDRLDWSAQLRQTRPDLRVCLDESIRGLGDLIVAHRLQALDELNLKPGRVGGVQEAVELVDYCEAEQIPVWVGGMFETGVGRMANLRLAARLPRAEAHDLSPSRRYFEVDVVERRLEMDEGGCVRLEDESPVTLDEARLDELCFERIELMKKP